MAERYERPDAALGLIADLFTPQTENGATSQ